MKIDSVLALIVAVVVCIVLITVAGIAINDEPVNSEVFRHRWVLEAPLPNYK